MDSHNNYGKLTIFILSNNKIELRAINILFSPHSLFNSK